MKQYLSERKVRRLAFLRNSSLVVLGGTAGSLLAACSSQSSNKLPAASHLSIIEMGAAGKEKTESYPPGTTFSMQTNGTTANLVASDGSTAFTMTVNSDLSVDISSPYISSCTYYPANYTGGNIIAYGATIEPEYSSLVSLSGSISGNGSLVTSTNVVNSNYKSSGNLQQTAPNLSAIKNIVGSHGGGVVIDVAGVGGGGNYAAVHFVLMAALGTAFAVFAPELATAEAAALVLEFIVQEIEWLIDLNS